MSASQTGSAWIPGSPNTTSTPCASSASTRAWAPVRTEGGATVTRKSLLLRGGDERHEVVDVTRGEGRAEVRRHDPVLVARGDVRAGIDDRRLDERVEILAGLRGVATQAVERGADGTARSGRRQRVAATAAAAAREDRLAVVGVPGRAARGRPAGRPAAA